MKINDNLKYVSRPPGGGRYTTVYKKGNMIWLPNVSELLSIFITNFLYKKQFFVTLIVFCGLFIDV